MLNYVIKKLLDTHINHIVCEKDIDISGTDIQCDHIVFINDVRSATFYSLGLAQQTQEPVILIVKEKYIGNVFTGLTEAWFQQRAIYVVAIGEDILNSDITFLKPCTQTIIKVQKETDFDHNITNISNNSVPIVFLIQYKQLECERNEKFDISPFIRNLNAEDKVLAYEPICTCSTKNNVEYISDDDKYGMISKYMGLILGSETNYYLITSTESVDLDMNIFNNRYMCSKFKVIVIGEKLKENKCRWIKKNGIFLFNRSIFNDETIIEFLDLKKPAVWNLV